MFRIRRLAALSAGALVLGSGALIPSVAIAATPGGSSDTTIRGVRVHIALPEQWLNSGGSWTFGNAHLLLRGDGNLVIQKKNTTTVKWQSNTANQGVVKMLFKHNGDLQLLTSSGRVIWHTKTDSPFECDQSVGESQALGLQNDSNFVIYCGFENPQGNGLENYDPIWATNTNGI